MDDRHFYSVNLDGSRSPTAFLLTGIFEVKILGLFIDFVKKRKPTL
jgi:hypothetical protein